MKGNNVGSKERKGGQSAGGKKRERKKIERRGEVKEEKVGRSRRKRKGGKWKGKRNWRGGNGMEITKTQEESKGKGHARTSRQCSVPNFGV